MEIIPDLPKWGFSPFYMFSILNIWGFELLVRKIYHFSLFTYKAFSPLIEGLLMNEFILKIIIFVAHIVIYNHFK